MDRVHELDRNTMTITVGFIEHKVVVLSGANLRGAFIKAVETVPSSSFFREPVNNLIRMYFAKRDETLNDALNRLETLRDKIKPKHR